jgi:hypothetical protein
MRVVTIIVRIIYDLTSRLKSVHFSLTDLAFYEAATKVFSDKEKNEIWRSEKLY